MRASAVSLTDSDVDAIAYDFLHSQYVDGTYSSWPLDRRLETFLRRSGLGRVADDGDLHGLLLDRAMAYYMRMGSITRA